VTINQGLSDLKPREKEVSLNGLIQNTFVDLVAGIPTPLKNDGGMIIPSI